MEIKSAVHRAFADESFQESPDNQGFYVLAAVVFEPEQHEAARELVLALPGRPRNAKLHWTSMSKKYRHEAARRLAELDGIHVVAIGSPVAPRRQERARAACLTRLVHELHGCAVTELVLEARTAELDEHDITTATGARYQLPKGTRFRVTHQRGTEEPLFWAADIVAGAVRAGRMGKPEYRELLGERLYDVEVDTGR
ncbi:MULTISPECIES: DUF3800 domain-containing protein [Actinosynnema]|uniref:DUF3800 domain-containing protein n=1 Tax=Actinosynnema TaxID=40566 RepID=UPI0020A25E80|nr:DUF3800 domain-containing protein [Actinosynnema pretiosum]MCP2093575.1 Protein of unknown function (DUF3800) [Actinosynnema pretiosum]